MPSFFFKHFTPYNIYLDDAAQDYQALNDAQQLPQRTNIQAETRKRSNKLSKYVQKRELYSTWRKILVPHNDDPKNPQDYEATTGEDNIIYADGANIITEHDTPEQINGKLTKYQKPHALDK